MVAVDVYDALAGERSYNEQFAEDTWQMILREGAEYHFDPEVIDAFFANIDEIVRITKDWMD